MTDAGWVGVPTDDGEIDADAILRMVRARMAEIRPLVEEHDRLAEADAALDTALGDARAA